MGGARHGSCAGWGAARPRAGPWRLHASLSHSLLSHSRHRHAARAPNALDAHGVGAAALARASRQRAGRLVPASGAARAFQCLRASSSKWMAAITRAGALQMRVAIARCRGSGIACCGSMQSSSIATWRRRSLEFALHSALGREASRRAAATYGAVCSVGGGAPRARSASRLQLRGSSLGADRRSAAQGLGFRDGAGSQPASILRASFSISGRRRGFRCTSKHSKPSAGCRGRSCPILLRQGLAVSARGCP
jgi:hypothetical protein